MKLGSGLTLELARLAPVSEALDIWLKTDKEQEVLVDKLCSQLVLDVRELDEFANGEGKDLCSRLDNDIKLDEDLQLMRFSAEYRNVIDFLYDIFTGQILRFPRRVVPWKMMQNLCKVANQSESFYRCMSEEQWLRTVSEADPLHPCKFLVFHSNVVPRQAYWRMAPVNCSRQGCTGGFFRISEGDSRSRQCRGNCDLAKQLKPASARPVSATEETRSPVLLPSLEENDTKLVETLAEGSDGKVSKIIWRRGLFARKEFPRVEGPANPSFDNERDVARNVSHPNIVHCFSSSDDCPYDSDYSFLTMELLEEELEGRLLELARTEESFSFRDSLLVLWQIAEAMEYLHRRNFVHGDLKPGNILISRLAMPHSDVNNRFYLVKVADFGRTQRVDTPNAIQSFRFNIGTMCYVAPEVYEYRRQQTKEHQLQPAPQQIDLKKTDVFSFGVVAYQVLTGLPNRDLRKNYLAHEKENRCSWTPRCAFNGDLKGDRSKLLPIIEKCWSSSPQNRPDFSEICGNIQSVYNLCVQNEHHVKKQKGLKVHWQAYNQATSVLNHDMRWNSSMCVAGHTKSMNH